MKKRGREKYPSFRKLIFFFFEIMIIETFGTSQNLTKMLEENNQVETNDRRPIAVGSLL